MKAGILDGAMSKMVALPSDMPEEEKADIVEVMASLGSQRSANGKGIPTANDRTLVVRLVSARHDRVVLKDATNRLAEILQPLSSSFETKLVSGGHVTAIANSSELFVPEIIATFEDYAAAQV